MSPIQALLLGALQGATEFLPVSSSGHLVIIPHLLGWSDPGLAVYAILHLGTLLAVLVYFWNDLWRLARAALQSLQTRSLADPDARIAWAIALGTVPGALIGFLFDDFFEAFFGYPRAAAGFLLGTAVLLLLSEYLARKERTLDSISWKDAFLVGLAQTFAIAPGLSRSGSTIAAGLLLGYRREEAARFSFLLAVPIVLGSGLYEFFKLVRAGLGSAQVVPLVLGFVAAAAVGYVAIAGLLALVRRQSLWPFAAYCAILGVLVLSGVLG